jgi:hypothetical protein
MAVIKRKSLSSIRKIKVYDNVNTKQSISTVKSNEAPHWIINGTFFMLDSSLRPVGNELWVDGASKNQGDNIYWGYDFETGITWMQNSEQTHNEDFIGGFPSLRNSAFDLSLNDPNIPAVARRVILGHTSTDLLYYYSQNSITLPQAATALVGEGIVCAINLDSNSSTKYSFDASPSATPFEDSSRTVSNFIMFWFNDQTMPTRSNGNKGWVVSEIQRILNRKTNAGLVVDGIFGSGTKAAVMSFQQANGLSADGAVGPLTWAKLDA